VYKGAHQRSSLPSAEWGGGGGALKVSEDVGGRVLLRGKNRAQIGAKGVEYVWGGARGGGSVYGAEG